MGVPKDKDAKRYYRAAGQRSDEARFLLEGERAAASVYLSGYCVECMLKALIIAQAGKDKKDEVVVEFTGAGARNYDRLLALYEKSGGSHPPKKSKELTEAFVIVRSWKTDLRYDPSTMPAEDFLSAVRGIHKWADGRL